MAKLYSYIDVSRKSQIVIVNPSRKSQERARERVMSEFVAFDKANFCKHGVVIVRRVAAKCSDPAKMTARGFQPDVNKSG